jgi:hypothetical protein
MPVKDRISAIPLISFNVAGLAGYQSINAPNGIPEACFSIVFSNNSNTNVIISYDGVTDHDIVLANSVIGFPIQTNAQPPNWRALLAKGTQFYVRGIAGVGTFFVSGYYQENQ